MRSLRFRLSLGLLISLLSGFGVLWMLVGTASRYLAEDYITTRLTHDSETLLSAIQLDSRGTLALDPTRIDAIYKRPFSGYYFKIISANATLRSRSLWDQDLVMIPLTTGDRQLQRITGPQHQPLLLQLSGYDKAGQTVTIAVAEDISTLQTNLTHFQHRFALTALVLLLVLVGIQGFILHAGLHPLLKTRADLQALTRGQLTQLNPHVPKEIAPLVEEINRLLDVLGKRLTRSRNSLGDLAHALKKPLTVLKQLLQDETLTANPALRQSLTTQLDEIQRHMTRILQRARLAGDGPVGSIFIADQEIPALLVTLQSMYRHKPIQFEIHITPGIEISIDREDMLELIGNLLDNACKWAQRRVRLSLLTSQGTQLQVEDDGPGVADSDLTNLTRRGLRLDETAEGHGLGLAIVHDIIENHGGSLQLARSTALGGLHVTVTLPDATAT